MNTRWKALLSLLSLAVCYATLADTALTRLYTFGFGNSAAANPYGRVMQASDGKLYGTTSAGGQTGQGTLFRVDLDGSGFVVLKSFGTSGTDGERPFGALIEASDGGLYGTTETGGQAGQGTIYKIGKDGAGFSVLKSFAGGADGANPEAGLIEGSDGLLYGTTSGGGSNDYGVVFRIGKDASAFTTLMEFAGTNGANPECELLEASDGMLYGTTSASNTNTVLGTVFKMQKDGTGFILLDRFLSNTQIKTNGAAPLGRLVEGTNGMLYGTASAGGTKGFGTLYRLNKDGTGFTMVYHFGTNLTFVDGRSPLAELTLASDGMLYGTTFDGGTNSSGTIFRIGQDGSGYTNFLSLRLQRGVATALIEATNGLLYGTSQFGGTSGDGTVFSLGKDGSAFSVIKSFSAAGDDGQSPHSPPIPVGVNQLVGTTRLGGSAAVGTVYSLRFDGVGYTGLSSLNLAGGPLDLFGSLLELTNGTLLGVSRAGGSANNGTIFSLDQTGANLAVAYSPPDTTTGSEFRGQLIQASDGLVYGTAISGGTGAEGTAFRMSLDGSNFTVLKNFAKGATGPGANPATALLEASDGNLYGTTGFGGTTNRGVLFSMSKDGSAYQSLKVFGVPATDGETPMSPVLEGSDGMLYGTCYGGGTTNNGGTVFRINKDGTGYQVLVAFAAVGGDARHPCGALVIADDGALYGTTERGGATDEGSLYRVNRDGSGYAVAASLGGAFGSFPHGVVLGQDGAVYITTDQGGDLGFGTVVRFGPGFGDIVKLTIENLLPTITSVGQPGTNYILEHTLQLGPSAAWTPVLSTNAPGGGRFSVTDQAGLTGGAQQNFYRLKW
jgi:uncharacterized repeat protein (TIGR03803 family)